MLCKFFVSKKQSFIDCFIYDQTPLLEELTILHSARLVPSTPTLWSALIKVDLVLSYLPVKLCQLDVL